MAPGSPRGAWSQTAGPWSCAATVGGCGAPPGAVAAAAAAACPRRASHACLYFSPLGWLACRAVTNFAQALVFSLWGFMVVAALGIAITYNLYPRERRCGQRARVQCKCVMFATTLTPHSPRTARRAPRLVIVGGPLRVHRRAAVLPAPGAHAAAAARSNATARFSAELPATSCTCSSRSSCLTCTVSHSQRTPPHHVAGFAPPRRQATPAAKHC